MKDRIDKKEVMMEYCPTYIMVAGFFTKALQGKSFRLMRDVIMGIISMKELFDLATKLKERVGKRVVKLMSSVTHKRLLRVNKSPGHLPTYADIVKRGQPGISSKT